MATEYKQQERELSIVRRNHFELMIKQEINLEIETEKGGKKGEWK